MTKSVTTRNCFKYTRLYNIQSHLTIDVKLRVKFKITNKTKALDMIAHKIIFC